MILVVAGWFAFQMSDNKDSVQEGKKGLIVRTLGSEDRRQMYFTLSAAGRERVCDMEIQKVEIPELLKPLFKDAES